MILKELLKKSTIDIESNEKNNGDFKGSTDSKENNNNNNGINII